MTLTKSIFRTKCLKTIKKSPKHNQVYKTALLQKKLMRVLSKTKGKKILFYYPLDFEADVVKILQKLRKNSSVFVPFMEGESFKMVPFRLPLKKKKFGIFEAGNTNRKINKIDIAIVPVVGVDGNFQRIGFGKGMYDRFYEKLPKKPYTIFVQSELCYTKKSLCDSFDVTGDILITPTKIVKKKKLR